MTIQTVLAPQYFYRTGPMPCPYLPGRIERNLFTELKGLSADELHDRLAQGGFRRSHYIVYRPACPGCNACVPVRVLAREFRRNRSLDRVWRRNADLRVDEAPLQATTEQYRLFASYQQARHAGGEMAAMSMADYRAMVEDTAVDTRLMELRDRDDRLLGAGLMDRLGDGLSAVYSFFDPEADGRSLGTFQVLWLLDQAQREDLDYVYLGYWIAGCGKMSYKVRFRPMEALLREGWRRMDGDGGTQGSAP